MEEEGSASCDLEGSVVEAACASARVRLWDTFSTSRGVMIFIYYRELFQIFQHQVECSYTLKIDLQMPLLF